MWGHAAGVPSHVAGVPSHAAGVPSHAAGVPSHVTEHLVSMDMSESGKRSFLEVLGSDNWLVRPS